MIAVTLTVSYVCRISHGEVEVLSDELTLNISCQSKDLGSISDDCAKFLKCLKFIVIFIF
jgi:hypothetical protein